MKRIINTYIAFLVVTLFGSGMILKIVDTGTTDLIVSSTQYSTALSLAQYTAVKAHNNR